MTLAHTIAWDDAILPFQLDRADVRGRVARLDGALQAILSRHDYPAPVAELVAEAALLTALIGQTIKLRWKLSLQVRGNGPVRLIATDYYAPEAEGQAARIRAWASFDSARLPQGTDHAYGLIGEGIFAILIDQGQGMTPYQGMTPLVGTSLADCAETYFAQSEQLPTRFALTSEQGLGTWRSGGIMVQQLPRAGLRPLADDGKGGASGHNPDSGATGPGGLLAAGDLVSGDDAENWTRATMLLQTVTRDELIGSHVTPDSLLLRLFHEEQPRVFDAQPVRFGCTCSAEKVEQAMSIYSAKDIRHMTTEAGKVTADCQFCGAHYEFAPETLGFEANKT